LSSTIELLQRDEARVSLLGSYLYI
jgi:hypothetical protein